MTRRPKRAYKDVAVAPSGNRYAVLLDGKPATAGAASLAFRAPALADAVAQEWREQGDALDPASMRLTALAAAALTRAAVAPGDTIEHILGYAHNELLCYRAGEPPELAARQKAQWDPLLAWIRDRHGIRLIADSGISFIEQPVDVPVRMQEIVSGLDDFDLAALDAAATLASSFVVALALFERHIGADEAFAISHLDELYQAEKWGRDPAAETRRARIIAEFKAIERFVSLLKD
ncbi:MAG TPA: ATP12 family protein [Rhizomicrobium sp.]|jgi:chaperone required for assembly of F1-ATPase|nr:ATP12 family protein [Rhizomicrobium sp.]